VHANLSKPDGIFRISEMPAIDVLCLRQTTRQTALKRLYFFCKIANFSRLIDPDQVIPE
jgi:hypothetical protein